MAIDFAELLGSLRSDGKLIVSTLIKAAAGKKFVTDARDSMTALTFDLEDEAGQKSTVLIPKGSAVDGTARTAAAAAQATADAAAPDVDLTAHEGSPHNTDATARAAAGTVATNLEQALVGLSISGNTLSASRQGGGPAASAIIPTGMVVADGVIVSAAVNVAAETVTVTTSTGDTVTWDLTAILDVVRALITVVANNLATHTSNHPAGYTDAEADARVQAAKGTATPGNTPGTPAAGTDDLWSPQDHDHGVVAGAGGTTQTITGTVRAGTPAVAAPIADNSDYSAAHGLGAVPDLVDVIAICTAATQGYAVGDVVTLNNDKDRLGVWVNATMVGFSTHPNRGAPYIINRTNRATESLTNASWSVSAVPYVYEDQSVTGLKGDKGDPGAASTFLGALVADNLGNVIFSPSQLASAGSFSAADFALITDASDNNNPKKVTRLALSQGLVAAGLATSATVTAVQTAVNEAFVGATISGQVLTLARHDGANPREITIPTGTVMADGVVVSAVVNVAQETVTVTTSTGDTVSWDLTAILDVLRTLITNAQTTATNAASAASSAQTSADAAATVAGGAFSGATAAQAAIDAHEANHPGGGGGGGLTAAQAARLLPTHTAAESDRIATSRDVADQWELATRRTPNPVLQTLGDVLAVRRNALGVNHWDGITLPDIGNANIPHVGSLPGATATSPDVLFLTHTHSRGARADAALTVGFSEGGLAGYSTERPAYGFIDKLSPLIRIYGAGDAASYSLQDFVSYSDDWLNEFSHVVISNTEYALGVLNPEHGRFFRRATNFPSSLSAAAVPLNFKRADGTYYFNNAAAGSDEAGLYVKRDDGAGGFIYNHLITFGDVHGSGIGPPVRNPRQGGATYINEAGELWTAAGTTFTVTTDPSGTAANFAHSRYAAVVVSLLALFADKGQGGFWWDWTAPTPGFGQFQGTTIATYMPNRTWAEVWDYVLTLIALTQQQRLLAEQLQAAVFLGRHTDISGALDALQFRIEGGETFAANKFYYGDITDQRVKVITGFTAGTSSIDNNFHWIGPFATRVDVEAVPTVEVNGAAAVDQGNANRLKVGAKTWGTKPVQDRRAAGLPAATIDTFENLYEDTRGIWRGSSYIDEERDGVGTFTDVAFGTAPFIGIFGRLTGLESLHPASGQAAGNFAIVEHAPDPGFYSVVSGHWVLAHTDAEVQALLDSLTGNSAGDSRYWGWHGNAVLAMHRRGAIDSTKKYYFFNYSAQRVQLLTNSTYVAGTEAGTIEYDFTLVTPASFPAGGEVVLYETAAAGINISASASLIPGNIVCPATGHLEVYFEQLTGDRQGSIAQHTIPAARLRAKINTVGFSHNNSNPNAITMTMGANRGISMACITTTFYLMLTGQSGGNYYIHISHRP